MSSTSSPTPRPALEAWSTWPVGTRVVVRRRLTEAEALATRDDADGERGKSVTDVIGIVLAVAPGESITLRTDAGGSRESVEVTIPAADVVAAKRIPPRPPRRLPRRPVD
ncbi:DUF6725 family protein [Oerskovia douganii]|uniref:DUF6725 family protein n=1 Tax=Oerskovia douganii TaxID=2762210 RepID=UPI001D11BDD1|nr:DUF6725 family protein [Oerskovia douganii]